MNTPNKITLVRLLLLPVIIFFFLADFIPYGKLVATIVFIIACLTDFVDGYVARKYNQVTDLGKFFDSIADKVLIMTGMILIIATPVFGQSPVIYPYWLGIVCIVIMLAREFIISALRQVAASKGIVLAAEKSGKIKATVQYVSVSLYMFYAFLYTDVLVNIDLSKEVMGAINLILMIFLVLATILTIYSGTSYIIKNRKVFVEKNEKNNKENVSNVTVEKDSVVDTEIKVEEKNKDKKETE